MSNETRSDAALVVTAPPGPASESAAGANRPQDQEPGVSEATRYYEELSQSWWALEARVGGVMAVAALVGVGLQMVPFGGLPFPAKVSMVICIIALVVATVSSIATFVVIWRVKFTTEFHALLTAKSDEQVLEAKVQEFFNKAKEKLDATLWALGSVFVAVLAFLSTLVLRLMLS
jgi:hypothetical protein